MKIDSERRGRDEAVKDNAADSIRWKPQNRTAVAVFAKLLRRCCWVANAHYLKGNAPG